MNEIAVGAAAGNGPRYPYIPLDDWKAQAKAGKASPDVTLIKGRSLDQINTVKNERDALRIVISTSDEDRSRDVIDQGGWNLTNYIANPVVLFAHDYWSPSVAKAPRTYPEAGKLVSYPEFCPVDLYPFGHMIGRMVREGFMGAASVGFRPLKWMYNEERGGVDFAEQELMEYSIVPVPDNPFALNDAKAAWQEALSKSVAKGLDVTPVLALVEASAGFLVKSGIVSNDAEREQALRVLTRGAVSVEVPASQESSTDLPAAEKAAEVPVLAEHPVETVVQVDDKAGDPPVEKAGREISAKNEKAIRSAVDAIQSAAAGIATAAATLSEILSRIASEAEDETDEDEEGQDTKAGDPAPLTKTEEPPAAPSTAVEAVPTGGEVLVLSIPLPAEKKDEVVTLDADGLRSLKENLTVLVRESLTQIAREIDRERAGALPD